MKTKCVGSGANSQYKMNLQETPLYQGGLLREGRQCGE